MINQEIANNIFYHIEKCWDYTYPTGQALETAVARGLHPFFEVEQLGSNSTITDVKADNVSIDVKGCKTLSLKKKITKRTNTTENNLIKWKLQDNSTLYISVPKSVITQVRRPKVDLQNYMGDAESTIVEQIDEYTTFAFTKSKEDGCSSLKSFIVQYSMESGKKFCTITVNEFELPKVEAFNTTVNQNGKNNGYAAYDGEGNVVYSLSSFNKGSSNMYKRYNTENFYYRAWEEDEYINNYNCDEVSAHISANGIVGYNSIA